MKNKNQESTSFKVEEELANEILANVLGGSASGKISFTVSLAATASEEAQGKKDVDSDEASSTEEAV